MPLKPFGRLFKAYHGLISSSKLTERFPSDEAKRTDGADKRSAQNDVEQSEGFVSMLTNLLSEIFRYITDHLPPESLFIRQTYQNLKHRITLSSDHADIVQCLAL